MRIFLKYSMYSQYLSSSWQLLYAFSDSLLDLIIFWQGKLHPITKHEQINLSIPMSNDIMPHCFNSFLFFFLWFFFCTSWNLSDTCNWAWKLVQFVHANNLLIIISQSKWVEGKNLILKFLVFHPFFNASLNKNPVYYLLSDFW